MSVRNRALLGAKKREAVAPVEADVLNRETDVLNRVVTRSVANTDSYPFAHPTVISPGNYVSHINGIKPAMTRSGAEAVDFLHELTNKSGQKFRCKMRFPLNSYYYSRLCDELINAGLPEGAPLSKAIGLEETVTLDYDNDSSIGRFISRLPINKSVTYRGNVPNELDDDPDFDHFMSDLEGDED